MKKIIVFDLHNVILLPDRRCMLSHFWESLSRFGFYTLFRPILLYEVWRVLCNHSPAEPEFDRYAQQKPILAQFKPTFVKMILCQRVNSDVIAIIDHLKNAGFSVYAASNLWASILPQMTKKYDVFCNSLTVCIFRHMKIEITSHIRSFIMVLWTDLA